MRQVNAFDINLIHKGSLLGLTAADEQLGIPRGPVTDYFPAFWARLMKWKRIRPDGVISAYTAYTAVANTILRKEKFFGPINAVNLDGVTFSDARLKPLRGPQRGEGREAYSVDGKVGLVLLPITFFHQYLPGDTPENPRGYRHAADGSGHGHGWFLRTLLSHALHMSPLPLYVAR